MVRTPPIIIGPKETAVPRYISMSMMVVLVLRKGRSTYRSDQSALPAGGDVGRRLGDWGIGRPLPFCGQLRQKLHVHQPAKVAGRRLVHPPCLVDERSQGLALLRTKELTNAFKVGTVTSIHLVVLERYNGRVSSLIETLPIESETCLTTMLVQPTGNRGAVHNSQNN